MRTIYLNANDWRHRACVRREFPRAHVMRGEHTCVHGYDELEGTRVLGAVHDALREAKARPSRVGHVLLSCQRELDSEEACAAARAHAKGQYQLAVLEGFESLSGAGLRGRASSYAGRYAASRHALLTRLWDADIPVWVELVDSRRWVLRFGAAPASYVDARRPSESWCPRSIPVMARAATLDAE